MSAHTSELSSCTLTSYQGMFDVGRLKDGDTVVISGAAGSVGLVSARPSFQAFLSRVPPSPVSMRRPKLRPRQIACQIALAHPKCKVVALASASKLDQLKTLGCHVVLDYTAKDFKKKFRDVGLVDVYFDNGALWLAPSS